MSGAALGVANLTVRHGGLVALQDVSLDVAEGEIAGLIGPNGAGKTTFIDALSGFTAARSGRVTLDGVAIGHLPAHERSRRGLVRTFQSLELFDDLTVAENLRVAADRGARSGLLSDLLAPRRRAHGVVDEVLGQLGLAEVAGRRPTELPNGARHLVALGRAMVARPRVLLLDEPAAGLDTAETAELASVLARLPSTGTTIVLVEHDMSVVLSVCDSVHVLDFGGVIASGTPAEIRNDPLVISAYLGSRSGAA